MQGNEKHVDEFFYRALESLDRIRIEETFQSALQAAPPMQVLEDLIIPALEKQGREWNLGKIALSQIYMSSRICEEIVERILPPMASERKSQPPHAIVTLQDYHILGKRIVLSVMRASGFDVADYNHMVVDELVERVIADNIKILLISTLMLPSALLIKKVRESLDERGVRVKIAVGGAPFLFDLGLWQEVGADAMGKNAADAVKIVQGWMEEMP